MADRIQIATTDIFICGCGHLRFPRFYGGDIAVATGWKQCMNCDPTRMWLRSENKLEFARKAMLDKLAKSE